VCVCLIKGWEVSKSWATRDLSSGCMRMNFSAQQYTNNLVLVAKCICSFHLVTIHSSTRPKKEVTREENIISRLLALTQRWVEWRKPHLARKKTYASAVCGSSSSSSAMLLQTPTNEMKTLENLFSGWQSHTAINCRLLQRIWLIIDAWISCNV
jgi:hypothetical protein